MRYLSDALMEFIERNKSEETKKTVEKWKKDEKNNKGTLNDFYY